MAVPLRVQAALGLVIVVIKVALRVDTSTMAEVIGVVLCGHLGVAIEVQKSGTVRGQTIPDSAASSSQLPSIYL